MSGLNEYRNLRETTKKYYDNVVSRDCPALGQPVNFNSKGFKHIVYMNAQHERDQKSQMARFKLLDRAVKLISITTTYQEFECIVQNVEGKTYKEKTLKEKDVTYWGIIAIVEDRKIKVILRKVGNGNIHFWSIIPAWKTNKRDGALSLMKGNPAHD